MSYMKMPNRECVMGSPSSPADTVWCGGSMNLEKVSTPHSPASLGVDANGFRHLQRAVNVIPTALKAMLETVSRP